MKKINLTQGSKTLGYPTVEVVKGVPVLHLAPDFHVYKRGEQFVRCKDSERLEYDPDCGSKTRWNTISDFANTGFGKMLFVQEFMPIPGCVLLSYLLEAVGTRRDFYDRIEEKSTNINYFYEKCGNEIDTVACLQVVDAKQNWSPDYDIGEIRFGAPVVHQGQVVANLLFGDNAVWLETHPSGQDMSHTYIHFPFFREVEPVDWSRRDYYFTLWSHLWRQLLAASGILADKSGFDVEGELFPLPSNPGIEGARSAEDVEKTIRQYVLQEL